MQRRRLLLWLISSAVTLGLIPAVALALVTAWEASAREECRINLRTLISGVQGYADTRGHYPSATVPNKELPPRKRLSWNVEILDHLEGGGPWLIDGTMAWDEGVNRVLRRRDKFSNEDEFVEGRDKFRYFHCPANEAIFDAGGRRIDILCRDRRPRSERG